MTKRKIDDKGSIRKDMVAEKLPTVIQSKTITVSGVGLCNFSMKINTATTNDAKTEPLAMMPVKDFDKLRFVKPMIAQLMSGNRGINQTKCDIMYFLPPSVF